MQKQLDKLRFLANYRGKTLIFSKYIVGGGSWIDLKSGKKYVSKRPQNSLKMLPKSFQDGQKHDPKNGLKDAVSDWVP